LVKTAGKHGKTFEKKLSDLEGIVSRLESGETPLEESLALFEKGTALLKDLAAILEEAERKVEVLSRDSSGVLSTRAFEKGD